MKHKLLKISLKLSWQPKVNKRKAHLWWTLIQKEGRDILSCFNTSSIYVAIQFNGLELLRKGQYRQMIGSWVLLGCGGYYWEIVSFSGERRKKRDTGNGFFLICLALPQIYYGKGVTHLWRPAGSISEWGQIQIQVSFGAPVKSVLAWNLAPHNTSTFLLEGRDCALGQDMLASCTCQCLCQHYKIASLLRSHPHCTVRALCFHLWPGLPFPNQPSLHSQSTLCLKFFKASSSLQHHI